MPQISVCIPVFRAEKTLEKCLNSVENQTFRDFEVLILDDASDGKDEKGRSAKKIAKEAVKRFKKNKVRAEFIQHPSNMGLLEARRTLVGAANGDFIAMLDSDDEFLPQTLEIFFENAQKSNADIVHARALAFLSAKTTDEKELSRLRKIDEKARKICGKTLFQAEIRENWLVQKEQTSFLWGKLIRTELYRKAFEFVPFFKGTMAEDFIQYFFITTFAQKYIGIDDILYKYRVDSGITSNKAIDSLEDWQKIAQTADIFKAVFAQIKDENLAISNAERESLNAMCRNYLANNLLQMQFVKDDLKAAARQMLCDFWGEHFVNLAESSCAN